MKKLLIVLLCLGLTGCATSISYKNLVQGMHKKKILTDREYRIIRERLDPAFIERTYKEWVDRVGSYMKATSDSAKRIGIKIANYIKDKKQENLDIKINYSNLLEKAYRNKDLSQAEYEKEKLKIDNDKNFFVKKRKYEEVCKVLLKTIKQKNLAPEKKKIYSKMYNYALEEEKKAIARRQMMAYALIGIGESFGNASSGYQQSYQQPTYYPVQSSTASTVSYVGGYSQNSYTNANTEYLGQLSSNVYSPNSTSNQYGTYGNPYLSKNINNPYGRYGNPYSSKSVNNPYTTNAPKLYDSNGNYRGKLSSNPYDPDSVSNPYGRYGSEHSPDSINNPYGAGNPYSSDSPNNPYGSGLSILGDE